jgi:hypothetical protein
MKCQRQCHETINDVMAAALTERRMIVDPADVVYEVAAIIDIRLCPDPLAGAMNTGAIQFRVRWKGYTAAEDT